MRKLSHEVQTHFVHFFRFCSAQIERHLQPPNAFIWLQIRVHQNAFAPRGDHDVELSVLAQTTVPRPYWICGTTLRQMKTDGKRKEGMYNLLNTELNACVIPV